MPPYSIDVPIWMDIKSFGNVQAYEVSGVLHDNALKNERLPFNEATFDASVAATIHTMLIAGFTPGFIAETIHPCHPDTWRAF